MACGGRAAAASVYFLDDMGVAGLVMAFSILVAFVGQMLRRDGRHNLVEDLSSTVAGCLVVVSGSAWCALEPGLADPAVVVPTCLALFVGAVLTVLNVRARMLEALTVMVPALLAGGAGYVLAAAGFFGLSHISAMAALQSAVAIRLIEQTDNGLVFRSGGGITVQSDVQEEYRELIQKVYVPLKRG